MPVNPLPDFIATTGFNVDGYDIVQTFWSGTRTRRRCP
jgi:hypothetical protein